MALDVVRRSGCLGSNFDSVLPTRLARLPLETRSISQAVSRCCRTNFARGIGRGKVDLTSERPFECSGGNERRSLTRLQTLSQSQWGTSVVCAASRLSAQLSGSSFCRVGSCNFVPVGCSGRQASKERRSFNFAKYQGVQRSSPLHLRRRTQAVNETVVHSSRGRNVVTWLEVGPWLRNIQSDLSICTSGRRNIVHTNVAFGRATHRTRYFHYASQVRPFERTDFVSQLPAAARPRQSIIREELPLKRTLCNCSYQPRDTPPKRDTGIASEKDWGINLKNEKTSESGVNEDGSTWYRETGEDLGENGYRCRWTVMGGKNADGTSEWKEAWWEKSDWTDYKELGAEKSGRNAQGDTWWETWQEILRQDDWSNLARIEKSAQKQAKSGNGTAGWYEKWWEKYNAKGWSEKGAHKYGRLNDQGWWEKWGEQYDGRGSVLKWTDKWAETDMGSKWGDKWEEKFNAGVGTRQGETWHYSATGERWSRTWGEEHFGNGKVHKYGESTSGESWDSIVEEGTFYQAEPHYGWADAIGNSGQLLSIVALERPPGIYPDLDLGINRDQP